MMFSDIQRPTKADGDVLPGSAIKAQFKMYMATEFTLKMILLMVYDMGVGQILSIFSARSGSGVMICSLPRNTISDTLSYARLDP